MLEASTRTLTPRDIAHILVETARFPKGMPFRQELDRNGAGRLFDEKVFFFFSFNISSIQLNQFYSFSARIWDGWCICSRSNGLRKNQSSIFSCSWRGSFFSWNHKKMNLDLYDSQLLNLGCSCAYDLNKSNSWHGNDYCSF